MCIFCFKELNRWCKSFTKTEICLSLLETIFLIAFITSLTLLILHFLVCAHNIKYDNSTKSNSDNITLSTYSKNTTLKPLTPFKPKTFPPGANCTWKPSERTVAPTHYYEQNIVHDELNALPAKSISNVTEEFLGELDGEYADDAQNDHTLALVKFKPPRDVIFGCMLTIISEFWTVTAASCIDAIEELDSLDYFVMMEKYGAEKKGKSHVLSDVQVHPLYQNGNRSYDLALLKSEDSLTVDTGFPVELPTILDYLLTTVGESFTVLGFGPLRTIDKSPSGRRLHAAPVHRVAERLCGRDQDGWALRHLTERGGAMRAGGCGRGAVCAGPLRGRGAPCYYCAGTPLLHRAVLLGIMSDNQQCGVSCEPQIYVNIAVLKPWIDYIIGNK